MPFGTKPKQERPPDEGPAKTVNEIRRAMVTGDVGRASHMLNVALAGFKYLILHSESDAVRLQACKAVTELPMCQARMGGMIKTMATRDHHQHLHVEGSKELSNQLAELLVGKNPAALQALELAESQIVPVKSQETIVIK